MSPSVIDWVAPYCDVVERIRAIPGLARVRGLYFKSIDAVLADKGLLAAYRERLGCEEEKYSGLAWYSLGDYVAHIAVAGGVVAGPEKVHEGMYEISRANSTAFAKSLLGRVLSLVSMGDPVRVTEHGLAARRQTTEYGAWKLVRHGERDIEMQYTDEYVWIESAIAGAAAGAFEALGITPRLDTQLTSRFCGSTRIQW